MAGIEKRLRGGRTAYRVRRRDPNGGQHSKQFETKRDARIHLTRGDQRYPDRRNMKLHRVERSAVRGWITTLSESGLAPETVQKIHQTLRMLLQAAVDDGKLRRQSG